MEGETSVLPERLMKEFINEENHRCIYFVVNVVVFKELIENLCSLWFL